MKKALGTLAIWGGLVLMGAHPAWSLSPETAMLLDLLKAKGVITQTEAEEFARTLEKKTAEAKPVTEATPATETKTETEDGHYHSVKSLADRVVRLEEKSDHDAAELLRKVDLSGLIEVEMTSGRTRDGAGNKENHSDLALSTAQLNADAEINPYVSGHLSLLYEESDEEDASTVTLDEAIVNLKGGEAFPAYANIGRLYVPFGHFESHFISDPLTLTLGETNDTAVVAGYANDTVELNAGVLRGKVKETGKSDHIDTAVASATLTLPPSEKGLNMSGGLSYLSNLATSDGLAEITTTGNEVAHTVDGISAFLSLSYADRFFLDAEYLGALDDFAEGDFEFTDAKTRRPRAWNVEAAARLIDRMEFALRYGGSDEGGEEFLAENEYGGALLYNIFDKTNLTVEYLFQEFRNNSNNSQATMQLAVEL